MYMFGLNKPKKWNKSHLLEWRHNAFGFDGDLAWPMLREYFLILGLFSLVSLIEFTQQYNDGHYNENPTRTAHRNTNDSR